MVDKVKHWPSWANWSSRDAFGKAWFHENEPHQNMVMFNGDGGIIQRAEVIYELVEIDPQTPWQESKQRRPE